jgi:hypothetical protein
MEQNETKREQKTFKNCVLVFFSHSIFSFSETLLDAFSIYLRHIAHYSLRQKIRRYYHHNGLDYVTVVCWLYICLHI